MKLNMTAILREGARIQRLEEEEEKRSAKEENMQCMQLLVQLFIE